LKIFLKKSLTFCYTYGIVGMQIFILKALDAESFYINIKNSCRFD